VPCPNPAAEDPHHDHSPQGQFKVFATFLIQEQWIFDYEAKDSLSILGMVAILSTESAIWMS